MIQKTLDDPNVIAEVNENLITLIPKVEHVIRMKDFRSSNVSYKIITKILAHRLKPFMERLICRYYCNFIPKRQSTDNIVIAQEVFHSMRKKKGAKG